MLSMDEIIVNAPNEGERIDPGALFGSQGPFELEIGCGKGGFLLQRAQTHPEVRLLGIEWANKFFLYASDRMFRWKMENVRMMRTDASRFVRDHLPVNCLAALHVYHPDPWPKKRHHKRRLIQTSFADAAVSALLDGAVWLLQTDHAGYYEQMREVLDSHNALLKFDWGTGGWGDGPEWSGTNFEIKYRREGRSIYRAAYRVVK